MANAEVNHTNKLADRILQDARADAEKTMLSAEDDIRKINEELERKTSVFLAENESSRKAAVKSVIDGCLTRASLDGRKALLAQKRKVIDRTFDLAYKGLKELPESSKEFVYSSVIRKEAVAGDTIIPAAGERSILKNVITELSEMNLKLSDDSSFIDGGFLIQGNGYEKDCSLSSILSDLRVSEETNVAKMLFD